MNRLQFETSPYLLQHAHNPVDWYAWKPEAFARAKAEDKPILVSIGYSTCHWCHVMERESFENPDVAALMNENFVCIKVDREERPDVDAIYMEACQLMTGSGGWPLNCFLTPDGQPFYAGTYYPPRPAFNRPSWPQILLHLSKIWRSQRHEALEQAQKLMQRIRHNDQVFVNANADHADTASLQEDMGRLYHALSERYDEQAGGFGGAPKFPSSLAYRFLLRFYQRGGARKSLDHTLFSLDRMAQGGIYDQLGGGFARYATDREWLIPHFEKMLYDNALLLVAYAEAVQLLRDMHPEESERIQEYERVIRHTLEWVDREMTHPEGGFYSAQDADSEGVEGKFFVWQKNELDQLLGEQAPVFHAFFGVTEQGNWEESNILTRKMPISQLAEQFNIEPKAAATLIESLKQQAWIHREQRIHPGLDNKSLMDWNALMISALARVYMALGDEVYRERALKAVEFVENRFGQPQTSNCYFHTFKDGKAQYDAFLDDYAFYIAALIDVYEISFDRACLYRAAALTEHVIDNFFDEADALFFFTDKNQTDVVMRKKELYDNATPSGAGVMVHNLRRLSMLLERPEWREMSLQMLLKLKKTVVTYPQSFGMWAIGLWDAAHEHAEIAVVGDNALEKARALSRSFLTNYVLAATLVEDNSLPLLAQRPGDTDGLIYVCRDFACLRPVQSTEEAVAILHAMK